MNNEKIAKRLYSKRTIDKITKKIKLLGINNTLDPYYFLSIRLVSSVLIFIIVLILFPKGYIYAPIISIIYYYLLFYLMIDYPITKRSKKLEYEALEFFEILTLCIETGKNLKNSIEITCNNINGDLSNEFKQALKEIDMSKTLNKALKSMRERIPSDNVNNIILNISETSIFGGTIVDTMHNQLDFLNDKKIQSVRAEITKLPMKHSIISTLFFIPLVLLLILGPILINLYNDYVVTEEVVDK